jgi:seryl-tRNA synthetase
MTNKIDCEKCKKMNTFTAVGEHVKELHAEIEQFKDENEKLKKDRDMQWKDCDIAIKKMDEANIHIHELESKLKDINNWVNTQPHDFSEIKKILQEAKFRLPNCKIE